MNDDKVYDALYKQAAKAELLKEDHNSKPERILSVIKFTDKINQVKVEEFLRSGFQELKSAAAAKSKLINSFIFDALARAVALW